MLFILWLFTKGCSQGPLQWEGSDLELPICCPFALETAFVHDNSSPKQVPPSGSQAVFVSMEYGVVTTHLLSLVMLFPNVGSSGCLLPTWGPLLKWAETRGEECLVWSDGEQRAGISQARSGGWGACSVGRTGFSPSHGHQGSRVVLSRPWVGSPPADSWAFFPVSLFASGASASCCCCWWEPCSAVQSCGPMWPHSDGFFRRGGASAH